MNNEIAPKQDLSAPAWGVIEATDADEQAHNLRDWQQQYDQISRGAFYGRIDEVTLKHIHTFREYTNQAVRQQCNVWPNSVWLGFAADNQSCRINGYHVSEQTLMLRPGNTEFELVTPEQFNIYGMVVNQQALQEVAEKQGIICDLSQLDAPLREGRTTNINRLKYILNELIKPEHADSAGVLLQDILLMSMLDIIQQDEIQPQEHPSFSRRKAVVDKVKDYLNAHPDKQTTITELCELTHVSRRTLQYSFEDVMGLSPLRYLRLSRLNGVRRELVNGIREDETIALVAERWGFWHAGQFTHDYTQLFGENPSVTLQRSQG